MKKTFLTILFFSLGLISFANHTDTIPKKGIKKIAKKKKKKKKVTKVKTIKTAITDSIKKQDSIVSVQKLAKTLKSCKTLNESWKKPSTKLTKMVITELTADKKKKVKTQTLTYGKNGFIKKIDIGIIDTYGIEGQGLIKRFNKDEIEYVYNSKNELTEEYGYKYHGSHRKQTTKSCYNYNSVGFVSSSSYESGGVDRPRNYEYDENCILTKVNREMPKIDYHIELNYIYDKQGKLTKLDIKSGEKKSNSSTFVFDDKKNPMLLLFPRNYTRAFPEKYNKHNPLKTTEIGKKYNYKDTFTYTYNKLGYPIKSVNKHYEKNKLKVSRTIEYFY